MQTLILGGGFGGITVAVDLKERLGDAHDVVLIDRKDEFVMGLRKLWTVAGIAPLRDGTRSRATLARHGVRVVQTEIRAIDPAAKSVETDAGTFSGDRLVVALGAEPRPDLVPGLAEHAHNVWDPAAVPAATAALASLARGRVLVLVAGGPYPCPPAPYEAVMLIDEHLRRRGVREQVAVSVMTVQPILMPNAGPAGSAWVGEQLGERGIRSAAGKKIVRVEAGQVVFEDGAEPFDLLIGVPPHRPPAVVREAGLTDDSGWAPVDPGTFATAFPGVFAIGDLTRVTLANGLPLPKAGLMAELQGKRVAAAIAAEELGEPAPPPFDGQGFCYIEMGAEAAGVVQGDFYAQPPVVTVGGVSTENAAGKRAFESERLTRWFGA
jgi:sulfide:quinone oxidoreductase